jgi:hypothetical protein
MDRELPIIFSTAMVRAILDGKKTQTRRVVSPIQVPYKLDEPIGEDTWAAVAQNSVRYGFCVFGKTAESVAKQTFCPICSVGDRLYVREAWAKLEDNTNNNIKGMVYRASEIDFYGNDDEHIWADDIKWKPSIHMPKKNTRIWLEVTGVRCTRLQDISAMDCIAEGIERSTAIDVHDRTVEEINKYREVWDSLNAKRGYGWDKNPWVWVIEFKKVLAPSGGESEGER